MIGMYGAHAPIFTLIFAIVSSVLFGLPFVLAPEGWGRAMRWSVPADASLVRYYARCLGLLTLAINGMAIWAALNRPELVPAYFIVLTPFCAAMVPLHIVGWLMHDQPWTETAEIPAWAAAFVACLLFFPVG